MKVKYIAELTKEELDNSVVIPCLGVEGYPCIIIKNAIKKTVVSDYETSNLRIKSNHVLQSGADNYYVHILESKNMLNTEFDTIYSYVFGHIGNPISDKELFSLINSLEEYFSVIPESEFKLLQIGVFGELLTICELQKNGYVGIIDKYHSDFYSRHDIELDAYNRIEIKTSTNEKRIHRFKHNQIARNDVNVYVASAVIEIAENGYSLFDMFEDTIALAEDPQTIFDLRKLMKKCSVDGKNKGITISFDDAKGKLRFYKATDLPQLIEEIPEGVTSVEYDVDCTNKVGMAIDEIVTLAGE